MKTNIVQEKSFAFAVDIVNECKLLVNHHKEYVLSKQLLRSGTSIGANIEEAIGGQSTKDFYAKMTIAYKEARESGYWLRLLHATDYLTVEEFDALFIKSNELCRIIASIQKTTKTKL